MKTFLQCKIKTIWNILASFQANSWMESCAKTSDESGEGQYFVSQF